VTARGASQADRADVISGALTTVGIVAALPAELRCLVRAGAPVGATRTVNARVLAQAGGIGAAAARRAAASLIADGVGALVSWGFAAGLDPALAAGTLIISQQLEPALPATPAAPDSSLWAERLAARLRDRVPLLRGTIACPNHVVRTAEEKRALGASGAVAADMESAAVAAAAADAGIPWLALRVLVDTVDIIVPESVAVAIDAQGRFGMTRFLRAMIHHPMDLARLPALSSAYRRAMRTLETVARTAAEGLLFSASNSATGGHVTGGHAR
jgi:adenosylhomocysteine nucleosidase